MILLPCGVCYDMGATPESTAPAESQMTLVCAVGHVETLPVCVLHAVEVQAAELEGALHCTICHAHPIHECTPLQIEADIPL